MKNSLKLLRDSNRVAVINIKKGSSRIVILIGKYAVKVPNWVSWRQFLHGLIANEQETLFSTMHDTMLCPVLFSLPGGFLNVMPRCEEILGRDEFLQAINYMNMRDDCICYDGLVENKFTSFGMLNGNFVVVDYG